MQQINFNLTESVKSILNDIISEANLLYVSHVVDINLQKKPVERLTDMDIKQAYHILNKISRIADDKHKDDVLKLNLLYNSFIPSYKEKQKLQERQILTPQDLKVRLTFLYVISEMRIQKLLLNKCLKDERKISKEEKYYEILGCNIEEIPKDGEDYKRIDKYITQNSGKTYDTKITLQKCYLVDNPELSKKFKKEIGNITLLSYGSHITTYASILKYGLKVPSKDAPIGSFYMHGKGIELSDCISKSGGFTYAQYSQNQAIILLCEVALGKRNDIYIPDFCGDQLPDGYNCSVGMGLYQPQGVETYHSEDNEYEVKVPVGPFVEQPNFNGFLKYNEMIIFDANQVKFKYLLKVKIEKKRINSN